MRLQLLKVRIKDRARGHFNLIQSNIFKGIRLNLQANFDLFFGTDSLKDLPELRSTWILTDILIIKKHLQCGSGCLLTHKPMMFIFSNSLIKSIDKLLTTYTPVKK